MGYYQLNKDRLLEYHNGGGKEKAAKFYEDNNPLPCRGEGAYPPRSFTQVHQRGELNCASQLQSSGQQTTSIVISRPESILIRQDKKGFL